MRVLRSRASGTPRTAAVVTSSGSCLRCAYLSAGPRPPKSVHDLPNQHISQQQSASCVCYSYITPSQQLQQALDIKQYQQSEPQTSLTTLDNTTSFDSSPVASSPGKGGVRPRSSRRDVVITIPTLSSLLLGLNSFQLASPGPAAASKLGAAADSAWEALGGGPADLTFPESWLGVWDVTSTLVSVDLPMGEDVVPNMASVQRAKQQDLQKPLRYQVAFMRNGSGKVVYDRRFNTAALLAAYYGSNMDFAGRINWNPQDPNALSLTMPGGLAATTRVLRRSEQDVSADRFETSEFMQQVFETDDPARPRVKASQCFTKYKFRDEAAAERVGGPVIVATQVVSDYLTPFDGEQNYLAAANKPITTYTYKMAFTRHHDAAHVASAVAVS